MINYLKSAAAFIVFVMLSISLIGCSGLEKGEFGHHQNWKRAG